jgi:hypothetical protein
MDSRGAGAELQVSDDGLRVQAGSFESLGGRLAGVSAPTAARSSVLTSSAAVAVAHAQVAAASVRCASRVRATADKLAAAARGYDQNEASSAAQLRALDPVAV